MPSWCRKSRWWKRAGYVMEELRECIIVKAEFAEGWQCSLVGFGELEADILSVLCRRVNKTWVKMEGAGRGENDQEGQINEIWRLFGVLKNGDYKCGSSCYRKSTEVYCPGCRVWSKRMGAFAVFKYDEEELYDRV